VLEERRKSLYDDSVLDPAHNEEHRKKAIGAALILTSLLAALSAIAIPLLAYTKGRRSPSAPPTYQFHHDPKPRKPAPTPAPAQVPQKRGSTRPDVVIQLPQALPAPGAAQPSRRSTMAPPATGSSRRGTAQQPSPPQPPTEHAPEIVLNKQPTAPPQPPAPGAVPAGGPPPDAKSVTIKA
jgi:hypothetical protein